MFLSTPTCEGFLSIKQALRWLYWRSRLRLQGADRVEFHSFGQYQNREDQITLMRVIARGECTPMEPLGDSKGLKPYSHPDCPKCCREAALKKAMRDAADEMLREI